MIKKKNNQKVLFEVELNDLIDLSHPLCILANEIDWKSLENKFINVYSYFKGRPAKEIRLMLGLQYLKYTFNHSDESVVLTWVENPYWQFFCGEKYFQVKCPINPSMMSKFRDRVKRNDMDSFLEETIKAGLKLKVITPKSLEEVVIDTTVQEKNITFPTDAKLYYRMLLKLVIFARKNNIALRQSYVRLSKQAFFMHSRYKHTRKTKMARKELRKLKTYLGRTYRDIKRKYEWENDSMAKYLLETAERLLKQKKDDKNKIYSLHEQEVCCIAKGKQHKQYEFGNKSAIATTMKECFVVGAKAFKGNPYDGHTLTDTINQVEKIIDKKIKHVSVDLGYRGHDYKGEAEVHVIQRTRYRIGKMRYRKKRRSSIEPIIGHMKNYGRFGRNYLKGTSGDEINTILSACGRNLKKLLKAISLYIWNLLYFQKKLVLFQY